MRSHLVVAAAVACASLLVLSPGIAAADNPDVVGKQYAEAKGLLGKAGMTPVVATVVGDRVAQDQCYVTSTSNVTSRDSSGHPNNKTVQVNLNCYVGPADSGTPGFSKGNLAPVAVAVRAAHDEATKKWKASPEGQKWCVAAAVDHPDWVPIPDCQSEEETQAMLTKKWRATPEGQVWCAKTETEHPEWAPIADCHPAAV
jgi:hypothetical protein